ncbi:hypothetical protein TNCV_2002291 [Trichonephila clavipes]|nr:hypothetical protein TNCV_2002291 [Trichonephila clavipes]
MQSESHLLTGIDDPGNANSGNILKSQGTKSGEQGGCVKTVVFVFTPSLFEACSDVPPQKPFQCFQGCGKSTDVQSVHRLRYFPVLPETSMLIKSLHSRKCITAVHMLQHFVNLSNTLQSILSTKFDIHSLLYKRLFFQSQLKFFTL